jgi:geranylgeranyl pyrophosphate synthase
MHAAIAVELVHTYSLVHDDLPCMDDDVERRGQPTVHVKYDVATAVLVGDALLAQAFAELDDARLVSVLARASGAQGMVAGQALDLAGIDGQGPDALLRLRELHRAKTGALIVAAATMGAISAGATREQLAHVQACADAVGLAFQVRDDLLDAPGDAANARPSYVTLLGPVGAGAEAERLAGLALAAAGTLPNPSALEMLARFAVQREH